MNSSHATVIGGVGLVGLALFQFVSGDYTSGVQSVLAALAGFGLHLRVGAQEQQGA